MTDRININVGEYCTIVIKVLYEDNNVDDYTFSYHKTLVSYIDNDVIVTDYLYKCDDGVIRCLHFNHDGTPYIKYGKSKYVYNSCVEPFEIRHINDYLNYIKDNKKKLFQSTERTFQIIDNIAKEYKELEKDFLTFHQRNLEIQQLFTVMMGNYKQIDELTNEISDICKTNEIGDY